MQTPICTVEFTYSKMVWCELKKFKYEVGQTYYRKGITMKQIMNFPNIISKRIYL